MMLIKDLVILGRACPEPLKDGRVTVCLAGWSETFGFVRLYPTRVNMPWKMWDVVEVDVERNEHDNREESWKIAGSKGEWETLANHARVVGHLESREQRRNMIDCLSDSCVEVLNEQKRSLGIIKPFEIIDTYFSENADYGTLFQLGLPGLTDLDTVQVKRDFPFEPRIRYRCPQCQTQQQYHDQKVLEWGFFEWLRKEPDKKEQVWDNAGFGNPKTAIYLFVGNQAAHRTSFIIITVLRVPVGPVTPPLFPFIKRRNQNL